MKNSYLISITLCVVTVIAIIFFYTSQTEDVTTFSKNLSPDTLAQPHTHIEQKISRNSIESTIEKPKKTPTIKYPKQEKNLTSILPQQLSVAEKNTYSTKEIYDYHIRRTLSEMNFDSSTQDFTKLDTLMSSLINNNSITNTDKTLLVWDIMKSNRQSFGYFTAFIFDLEPHIIVDDAMSIHLDQSSVKDSIDAYILIKKSLSTIPENDKSALQMKLNNFAYNNIYSIAPGDEELFRENIELYRLTTNDSSSFNKLMLELSSIQMPEENKLSLYSEWGKGILQYDVAEQIMFIEYFNNTNMSIENKKIITSIMLQEISNMPVDSRKNYRHVVDGLASSIGYITSTTDNLSVVNQWIDIYKDVLDTTETSILHNEIFRQYQDSQSIIASIILSADNIDIQSIDSNSNAIANLYTLYSEMNLGRVNSENIHVYQDVIDKIKKNSPQTHNKYSK